MSRCAKLDYTSVLCVLYTDQGYAGIFLAEHMIVSKLGQTGSSHFPLLGIIADNQEDLTEN